MRKKASIYAFAGIFPAHFLGGSVNSVGIPVVRSRVVFEDWQVSFYEEFEGLLFPQGSLHSELKELIEFAKDERIGVGFRREITISALPFLCAVRPEEKSLSIGTRRLSRELALMKLHEVNPSLRDT